MVWSLRPPLCHVYESVSRCRGGRATAQESLAVTGARRGSPFGHVGGDFWPLTDDHGSSSVSGTRVVTATLPAKWIEVVDESQNAIMLAVSGFVVVVLLATASIREVEQDQRGVHFRLGRVIGVREPGLRLIIPIIDRLWRVSLRIVTMPIQSQGIITRDNVSVDIAAGAYFRVIDARKSVVVIENVSAAIDQIAQTTLRNVVGQHSLDEVLAQTEKIK